MEASKSLEDIKRSWQGLSGENLKRDVSAGDVQKIIRQKSKSELSKIKRKLLIETIISALLLPVYLYYIHKINLELAYLTDILLVGFVVVISWPTIQLLRIGKLRNQETIVFLRKFVFHFDKTVKRSVISLLTLFPAFFIASFVMGFMQGYKTQTMAKPIDMNFLTNLDNPVIFIGIVVLSLLLLISGSLLIIKLYYMLMYGRHVKNLKGFLRDLEHQENE